MLASPQPLASGELGMAWLVVVQSGVLEEGAEYLIDATALTVGRSDDNGLSIVGDEYVSGHHARFEARRDGVYLEDPGSTNGTFVNGIRLTSGRRLAPGDVVRIGGTEMRFER